MAGLVAAIHLFDLIQVRPWMLWRKAGHDDRSIWIKPTRLRGAGGIRAPSQNAADGRCGRRRPPARPNAASAYKGVTRTVIFGCRVIRLVPDQTALCAGGVRSRELTDRRRLLPVQVL